MNLNKGIFRIWLIIVPIVWIVSFIFVSGNTNHPFYSCETYKEEICQCVHTLGNKQKTYKFRCGWGLTVPCNIGTNFKALGFKDLKSCQFFEDKAKKVETCYLSKEKVKSCELKRDKDRMGYIIAMILVIIFPLTFYPIYLGLRRLFMWVRAGFKK